MTRVLTTMVFVLGLWTGAAAPVAAAICGDADGNGTVSVSDGVQTLRAAAGLQSTCTPAVCDVDGSGAITVSDGVSVLRKAAGLAVIENCGGAAAQPATVLRELQPLFKYGLAFATGAPVHSCANAPDGEIDVETDEDGTTTSFYGCRVDDVSLFGDVTVGGGTLTFYLLEADTADEEDFIADYDGVLTLGGSGGARRLDGTVDVTTDSADDLTVTLANVIVTGGVLMGGTARVDLGDSGIADSYTRLDLVFDGSGVAGVVATQADSTTRSLRFDIATGDVS
ncbi:MAG: hypothetical protein B6D46_00150 [Polyangiaceae bacterium UTPRO1]|jgi:hypothetical protein|nr:hypothetical protein [Myxococcales bacterium]OQY69386.1 MAG: hypothetical protein B6D46_00150 [Polyangiaceae bacterium UTPRO1]